MENSDLVISLVRASASDDKGTVRTVVESLIADAKRKQQGVFAEKLGHALDLMVSGKQRDESGFPVTTGTRAHDHIGQRVPSVRLDDLFLAKQTRRLVEDLLEEQLRSSLLQSHGLDPRNRVLLVGPPGNGKTSLAEAMAETLTVPFFVVRYESVIATSLGETATRLKHVFDYVRTTPCVLFFDDFDTIAKERDDTRETGEVKRVVTSLLMQIDELPSYTVVVAASNHHDLLDRAVWRRFQVRVALPMPTRKELQKYFQRKLMDRLRPADRTTAYAVARDTFPISYAEAEELVRAVRRREVLGVKTHPETETVNKAVAELQERKRAGEKASGNGEEGEGEGDDDDDD